MFKLTCVDTNRVTRTVMYFFKTLVNVDTTYVVSFSLIQTFWSYGQLRTHDSMKQAFIALETLTSVWSNGVGTIGNEWIAIMSIIETFVTITTFEPSSEISTFLTDLTALYNKSWVNDVYWRYFTCFTLVYVSTNLASANKANITLAWESTNSWDIFQTKKKIIKPYLDFYMKRN